jgi:sugar lactone lactonase YvrE
MAVTPDGDYAYCCDYGEGTLWEVDLSRGRVRGLDIPGGFCSVIDVSPDGGLLLYRDLERDYKLYELATKDVTVLELGDEDCALRFDIDGRVVFRRRCDVYSLDPASGEESKVIDVPVDVPDYWRINCR